MLHNTLIAAEATRDFELELFQRLQAQALDALSPGDRARIEDLCPATACREELVSLLMSPPSAWWSGYVAACLVMQTEIASLTGREF
jgi:hypothetical protein